MYDFDTNARVCNGCGEAFAPRDTEEWSALRRAHRFACAGATFTITTIEKAF